MSDTAMVVTTNRSTSSCSSCVCALLSRNNKHDTKTINITYIILYEEISTSLFDEWRRRGQFRPLSLSRRTVVVVVNQDFANCISII